MTLILLFGILEYVDHIFKVDMMVNKLSVVILILYAMAYDVATLLKRR